jgi:hypothetical protein
MKKILLLSILALLQFSVLADEEYNLKYVSALEYNNKFYGYVTFTVVDKPVNGMKGMITLLDSNFKTVKEGYADFGNKQYIKNVAFNGESIVCCMKKLNSEKFYFMSFDLNMKKTGGFESDEFIASSNLNITGVNKGFLFSYFTKFKNLSGPMDPAKELYSNALKKIWTISPEQMPKPYNSEAFICSDGDYAFYTAVNKKDYSKALEVVNLSKGKIELAIPGDIPAYHAFYNPEKKQLNKIEVRKKDSKIELALISYDVSGKQLNENLISWTDKIDTRTSKDPIKGKNYDIHFAGAKSLSDGRQLINFNSSSGSSSVTNFSLYTIIVSADNQLLQAIPLEKKILNFSDPDGSVGCGFSNRQGINNTASFTTSRISEYFFTKTTSEGTAPYVVYMEGKKNKNDIVPEKVIVAHINTDGAMYEKFDVTDDPDACQVFPATGNRILILKYFKNKEKLDPQFVNMKQ